MRKTRAALWVGGLLACAGLVLLMVAYRWEWARPSSLSGFPVFALGLGTFVWGLERWLHWRNRPQSPLRPKLADPWLEKTVRTSQ